MGGFSTDYGSSDRYDFSISPDVTKKSAKAYAKDDDRVYTPPTKGLSAIGKNIKADSIYAAALLLDVTGSMKELPGFIIERFATLYAEANAVLQGVELKELKKGKKLEDNLDMAIVAIGDAAGDDYPLQVVDFAKGPNLVKGVNTIFPEGKGGGNLEESYDLGAYFLLKHCETPNVPKSVKPLLVIIGDEGFYEEVRAKWVEEYIGDKLQSNLRTRDVLKELIKKFDTYILRPEFNYTAEQYAKMDKQWTEVLGEQRILQMKDPKRLIDDFIGICGYASDNLTRAMELLERRQIDKEAPEEGLAKVGEVIDTLHPLLGAKAKAEKERLAKKYSKASK